MKNVVVLGSTGTLGVAALKVLKRYRKNFCVYGLVANENEALLRRQAEEVVSLNVAPLTLLASRDGQTKILKLIRDPQVDVVLNLISGLAGLPATLAALKAGKTLLLGNKESIVAAGVKIMKLAKPGQLIPLDSEHNAIHEILKYVKSQGFGPIHTSRSSTLPGQTFTPQPQHIEAIYLPCSGGPLRGFTKSQLKNVTPKQVLAHPVWNMGSKITVESATLLNKGFEIIEAHHFFGLPLSKIKVFLHPEGQIHGIVKFKKPATLNGPTPHTTFAYSAPPNMQLHIENALREAANLPPKKDQIRPLATKDFQALTSPQPDHSTFPGIKIVLAAFKKSITATTQKSSLTTFLRHEEKAIAKFLNGQLHFTEIYQLLSKP